MINTEIDDCDATHLGYRLTEDTGIEPWMDPVGWAEHIERDFAKHSLRLDAVIQCERNKRGNHRSHCWAYTCDIAGWDGGYIPVVRGLLSPMVDSAAAGSELGAVGADTEGYAGLGNRAMSERPKKRENKRDDGH